MTGRPMTPLDRKVNVTIVPTAKEGEKRSTDERKWVLKNYTNEDILSLLPNVKDALISPKPARDAYHFFDKAKRPTLDNDALFLQARADPARPKLNVMQNRAIEELWEFATAEEKKPFEDKAMKDIERFEQETSKFEADLADLQVKAAVAELSEFCKVLGLGHWTAQIRRAGFQTVLEMKTSLAQGRNAFFGRLEDVGLFAHDDHSQRPERFAQKMKLWSALESTRISRPARVLSPEQQAARQAALEGRKMHEARQKEADRAAAYLAAHGAPETPVDQSDGAICSIADGVQVESALHAGWVDSYGYPCEYGEVERVLAERMAENESCDKGHQTVETAPLREYRVQWAWGTHRAPGTGQVVERSWVPAAMLDQLDPGCAEALLLQEFQMLRDMQAGQSSRAESSRAAKKRAPRHDADQWQSALPTRKVRERKAWKIVSPDFLEARDERGLGLGAIVLPKSSPPGLKARDFARVHRLFDPAGTGLARPKAVQAMMQKLGVRVSCQEAMEMLWEADEDRAGQALAAQDLVDLYFRVATDTSGYEPRRLFNLVEFLLFSAPAPPSTSRRSLESSQRPPPTPTGKQSQSSASPLVGKSTRGTEILSIDSPSNSGSPLVKTSSLPLGMRVPNAKEDMSKWTLEAEEATRLVRQRYNGRHAVPAAVTQYLERMDADDISLTFSRFVLSPIALIPPQWITRA